jgi:transcriptional regulator with XRE-family HTH domain
LDHSHSPSPVYVLRSFKLKEGKKKQIAPEALKGFGKRVKTVRKRLGFTQAECAGNLSITTQTLSEIENGKTKPGFDFFYNLMTMYDAIVDYLFLGEGKEFRGEEDKGFAGKFGNIKLDENMEKFLTYFFRSNFVKFRVLSDFTQLMIRYGKTIKNDLEGDKGE